jgi:organic radical activating enzyme
LAAQFQHDQIRDSQGISAGAVSKRGALLLSTVIIIYSEKFMKKLDLLHSPIALILRKIILIKHVMANKIFGKVFYCDALSGRSNYNICINSDMTVSCNCGDLDGKGQIGDLSTHSLEELFSGPVASKFRKILASGKVPFLYCATCPELRTIDNKSADFFVKNYSVPKNGIMVENTAGCNLHCISCDRAKLLKIRKKTRLSISDIRYISSLIRQHGIHRVSYFNQGEPFLSDRIYDELSILKNDNPELEIYLSSNGMLIDNDRKRRAALMLDYIYFSIDGISQEMTAKYQRGFDFRKAYNNMMELVDFRNSNTKNKPLIEWKYVLFNWNDKHEYIKEAVNLAQKAKVDRICFVPTAKPIYGISYRYFLGLSIKGVRYSWRPYIVEIGTNNSFSG